MMLLIIGLTNITTIIDLFSDGDGDSATKIAVVDDSEDAGIIAQSLTAPSELDDETTFVLMDNQSLEDALNEAEEGTYDGSCN